MLSEEQREKSLTFQRQQGQIVPLVFHNEGKPIRNYYKSMAQSLSACRTAWKDTS